MTRKEYEVIAKAIRRCRPLDGGTNSPEHLQWERCVTELVTSLASENARFNAVMFWARCKL